MKFFNWLLNLIGRIYQWVISKVDGRKVYAYCLSVVGGIYYLHTERPDLFEFTDKELLCIGLIVIYLMMNRSSQRKIQGHKLGKYL